MDSGGNVYVARNFDNTIRKFGPTGTDLGIFADTGYGGGPVGLAVDDSGNLYVANYDGDNIRKFSPTGADLGMFAYTGTGTMPAFLAFAPIPEPSSFLLAAFGAVGVGLLLGARRLRCLS